MSKILIVLAFALVLSAGIMVVTRFTGSQNPLEQVTNQIGSSEAEKAGRDLSHNSCSGTGPGLLTHSPMDREDFSLIIPYGAMIGGHVTPIDHQYFAPKDYRSPRDAYEVYAMAASRLVEISERTNERGTEYRLVFSMTCTFLYYYDLVTSLSSDIKAAYDTNRDPNRFSTGLDLPVKAGQLIGRIGGQTLDFAVWDTTKPLKGFISPELYVGERWKLYTADPLDYYSPELKELALSRSIRTVEPISGKIDYDIDGRLIGNWFAEGSGGYAGPGEGREGYWRGHLAVAPDNFDPTAYFVSFGDFDGKESQFSVPRESKNPSDVSMESGLVKYELRHWTYLKADGTSWDKMSLTKGPKLDNSKYPSDGCVLFQLLETRILKAESFPRKNCGAVDSFTAAAKLYTR